MSFIFFCVCIVISCKNFVLHCKSRTILSIFIQPLREFKLVQGPEFYIIIHFLFIYLQTMEFERF